MCGTTFKSKAQKRDKTVPKKRKKRDKIEKDSALKATTTQIQNSSQAFKALSFSKQGLKYYS